MQFIAFWLLLKAGKAYIQGGSTYLKLLWEISPSNNLEITSYLVNAKTENISEKKVVWISSPKNVSLKFYTENVINVSLNFLILKLDRSF